MANLYRSLVATILIFIPLASSATLIDISQHSGIIRDSSGNYKTINGRGTISSINTGTQLQVQNRVPVPTSKGNQYVDISRTALVDLAKVGGALASLAKRLGPLGMAAGTVAYICAETNICSDGDSWQINDDPIAAQYPQTIPYEKYCVNSSCGPTQTTACQSYASTIDIATYDSITNGGTICRLARNDGSFYGLPISRFTNQCPDGYVYDGSQCQLQESTTTRPATDADFDNVSDQLNSPASTDHILDNGGDVPVDVSTPPSLDNSPQIEPAGSETQTLKDGNGNITGTQVTDRNLEITDGATSQNPNQINITEKTTVTNYDINNNITSSTETSTQPPANEAPAEQEDIEIEFDDVSDMELEEYEIPAMENYTSWGGGSCPAPIAINTTHWQGEIPTEPFCDFAEAINPFVLAFAALISAFIVTGVRGGGQE